MNLEDELRIALRRQQPSEAFTGRVLARVAERRRKKQAVTWMAVAAMFAGGAFLTADVREYQHRREAEARRAGRDLVIALKITSAKLHATSRMIRRRTNGV